MRRWAKRTRGRGKGGIESRKEVRKGVEGMKRETRRVREENLDKVGKLCVSSRYSAVHLMETVRRSGRSQRNDRRNLTSIAI